MEERKFAWVCMQGEDLDQNLAADHTPHPKLEALQTDEDLFSFESIS